MSNNPNPLWDSIFSILSTIGLGVTGNAVYEVLISPAIKAMLPRLVADRDLQRAFAAAFEEAMKRLMQLSPREDTRKILQQLHDDTAQLFPVESGVFPNDILVAFLTGDETELQQALWILIGPYFIQESGDLASEVKGRLSAVLVGAFSDVVNDDRYQKAWVAFWRKLLQEVYHSLKIQAGKLPDEQKREFATTLTRLEGLVGDSDLLRRVALTTAETLLNVWQVEEKVRQQTENTEKLAELLKQTIARQQAHFDKLVEQAQQHPRTYIPFFRDPFFKERPGEFEQLEALLFNVASRPRRIRLGLVGVTGMAGVGKTQLAVELAYRYQNRFPDGIFWMVATGKDLFDWQRQFAELAFHAEYLPHEDNPSSSENERRRAQHFCRYLAEHSNSLLILDNVEQPDLITSILPILIGKEPDCTILYTSRNRSAPKGVSTHSVEVLPVTEALQLLLETSRPMLFAQITAGDTSSEAQAAYDLCNSVGYLPLALASLRGLVARDEHMTLVRLANILKSQGVFDIVKVLDTTFRLSWDHVSDEGVQDIFKLACYFPEATPIPLWLLGLASGAGESRDIIDPLGVACEQLHELSLLEVLSSDRVRLHPLIREFGQHLIAEGSDKGKSLRERAAEQLASEFTNLERLEQRALRMGFWGCSEQIRAAYDYVKLLGTLEQVLQIEWIERWLDRESYLLADGTLWPERLPGLFYQQLFNHSVGAGQPLKASQAPAKWVRQVVPVGREEDQDLVRIFAGHSRSVTSVAFSPDGHQILTGSYDRTARLWETSSGKQLATLQGHSEGVTSVAFSPDGRQALTGSEDGTACLWEVATGQELMRFQQGHTRGLNSVAFSPDGTQVLTGSSDKTARLWDAKSGSLLQIFGVRWYSDRVESVAFSPDGTQVLTGTWYKTAQLWDAQSGSLLHTLQGHWDWVVSVAFSPDGSLLLTGSWDETARLWETQSGVLLHTLQGHTGGLNSVAFSPDGTQVLTGSSDETARLWDAQSGSLLHTLQGHTDSVRSAAFSPDGTQVLTGSSDETARLWDAQSGLLLRILDGRTHSVESVAFSPDGNLLFTGSWGDARLWETQSGVLLHTLQGHTGSVESVAFSPDGSLLLTGSSDKTARLWDVKSGSLLHILEGHTDEVNSVAFSPDGTQVFTISHDETARLWDAKSGSLLRALQGHTHSVNSIAFSPDGRQVLIGLKDGAACLWEIATGQELMRFQGDRHQIHSVAFSPDGRQVLTGSSSAACLWDVARGQELMQFLGTPAFMNSAVFSPDGRQVLTGSEDGIACLWDVASDKELMRFRGHTGRISSVAFSPDGRQVLTGSGDGTARLWDVASGKEPVRFQEIAWISSVAFSPDGRQVLISRNDGTTRLWDMVRGQELVRFQTQYYLTRLANQRANWVSCAVFSPDGRQVLTVSTRGAARLWEVATGQELRFPSRRFLEETEVMRSVTFSPDGRQVLTDSTGGTAHLWEVATGQELVCFQGDMFCVNCVAFSPDGRQVLTGLGDTRAGWSGPYGPSSARLWDVESGQELRRFQGHSGWINSVAFSPDGRQALTGSEDGTARLWDVESDQELARFQGITPGAVRYVAFSPDGHLVVTYGSGHIYFWQGTPPDMGRLVGMYAPITDIVAVHWWDVRHIVLAGTGGLSGYPYFYVLALEGM